MSYRILCPTDLSDASERALRYAAGYLARGETQIHLLHVDDLPTYGVPGGSALDEPLRETWRERLGRLAESHRGEVPLEVVMRGGRPSVVIAAYAAEADVDLIVMATRGRPALARAFLGAVADKVVRTATVPVVTINPEARLEPIRRILCPVDFSATSESALREATRLAERHMAQVHLLHVCQLPVSYVPPEGGSLVGTGLEATLEASAQQKLEALRERYPAAVPVVETVRFGAPHRAILKCAEEMSASLVVMGTHGRTGIARFVLGSVAERVLRLADVPLMVTHGDADLESDA